MLLFQSDLTGSLESGFETYLTGYPISESNFYVLARTWYAPEMERPGCVWTHSLIIEYADLAKFHSLDFLLQKFVKPDNVDFSPYSVELALEVPASVNIIKPTHSASYRALLSAVYENPSETVIVPNNVPTRLEGDVMQLWSDQWPRLRRGFKFCTGALSIKTLDEEEFDLQIVPERTSGSIARQSSNAKVIKLDETRPEDWTNIFDIYRREDIRKFLWAFGADIEGKRANYLPLLKLFQAINSRHFELSEVNSYVNDYFPEIDKGKFLKKNLYGSSSILPVSEKELVQYLVSSGETSMVNFEELDVFKRIIQLINEKKLSAREIGELLQALDDYVLDETFWSNLDIDKTTLFTLVEEYSQLAPFLIRLWPSIGEDERAWTLDYPIQRLILDNINYEDVEILEILKKVLASKSKIIFDFRRLLGAKVSFYTLDLINDGKGEVVLEDWIEYIVTKDDAFNDWLWENRRTRQRPIYVLLFRYLSPQRLDRLQLDHREIATAFEVIKNGATRDFSNVTACKVLALGFSDSSRGNYFLVEKVFSHVYQEVCANRINDNIWKYFSKDHQIRDYSDFFNPFALLSFFQKSRRSEFEVESWDVGRQLIVKTVNQFIRHSWPLQSFLETFNSKKEFKEALLYCYTFEKGIQLIEKLLTKVDNEKLKLNREQSEIVRKILS